MKINGNSFEMKKYVVTALFVTCFAVDYLGDRFWLCVFCRRIGHGLEALNYGRKINSFLSLKWVGPHILHIKYLWYWLKQYNCTVWLFLWNIS